jgi:hypothetical protein
MGPTKTSRIPDLTSDDLILFNWTDCMKLVPYRDWRGSYRWPQKSRRRLIVRNGRRKWQLRERPENTTANGRVTTRPKKQRSKRSHRGVQCHKKGFGVTITVPHRAPGETALASRGP